MLSPLAQVVELVDTPDLGSGALLHVGSSPILGIFLMYLQNRFMFLLGKQNGISS